MSTQSMMRGILNPRSPTEAELGMWWMFLRDVVRSSMGIVSAEIWQDVDDSAGVVLKRIAYYTDPNYEAFDASEELLNGDPGECVPGVGMAVAYDQGFGGVHSPHKQPVAHRMTLELRRVALGEALDAATEQGPTLVGACVQAFDNATNITTVLVKLNNSATIKLFALGKVKVVLVQLASLVDVVSSTLGRPSSLWIRLIPSGIGRHRSFKSAG